MKSFFNIYNQPSAVSNNVRNSSDLKIPVIFESNRIIDYFPPQSSEKQRIDNLFHGVCNGSRASLAEAITLVESSNSVKKMMAQVLLHRVVKKMKEFNYQSQLTAECLKHVNIKSKISSFRIGITGPPGAGKSTFIESFGMFLTSTFNLKVAVLAVDPSSNRTGGSLLGDKTRMPKLSLEPRAYVRPSPNKGELGGVACNTIEAVMLCEGAGYDVVLIETVGVGQSEVRVADMTDMFVLVIPPAGGDELQGLKRGVIENCDLVVVNKADGDLLAAARKIQTEYLSALKFIPHKFSNWTPVVKRVSSKNNEGIEDIWNVMLKFYEKMWLSGNLEEQRHLQKNIWMWNRIESQLLSQFKQNSVVNEHLPYITKLVQSEDMTPGLASDVLIQHFFSKVGSC